MSRYCTSFPWFEKSLVLFSADSDSPGHATKAHVLNFIPSRSALYIYCGKIVPQARVCVCVCVCVCEGVGGGVFLRTIRGPISVIHFTERL